jgi:hypothetical protein
MVLLTYLLYMMATATVFLTLDARFWMLARDIITSLSAEIA